MLNPKKQMFWNNHNSTPKIKRLQINGHWKQLIDYQSNPNLICGIASLIAHVDADKSALWLTLEFLCYTKEEESSIY